MPTTNFYYAMKTKLQLVVILLLLLLQKPSLAQQPQLMLPVGHTRDIVSTKFSPDGKYIITASYDGSAKIWDAQSGRQLHSLEGNYGGVSSASYSPDGKYIVTADGYGGGGPTDLRECAHSFFSSPPSWQCRLVL